MLKWLLRPSQGSHAQQLRAMGALLRSVLAADPPNLIRRRLDEREFGISGTSRPRASEVVRFHRQAGPLAGVHETAAGRHDDLSITRKTPRTPRGWYAVYEPFAFMNANRTCNSEFLLTKGQTTTWRHGVFVHYGLRRTRADRGGYAAAG